MKSFVIALFGAAIAADPVAANAVSWPGSAATTNTSEAIFARYRGNDYGRRFDGGRRYGYRRNSNGRNIGNGSGAAIIGGIALSEAARAEHRSSNGSQWNRCAETYRSVEPSTVMYTGYDGVRRTCSYLN